MLSIIIVNYNVKYFLEQCLYSVQKAIAGIQAEVIVVDNNSADESVAYLQNIFPRVIFISNKENAGYAKANNQGLQIAKGEYILFVNPDIILAEDSLTESVRVLQQDAAIGALGIRMVDGTGHFLPESKRGFPTPGASFFKLSGLIKMFPHAASIARYYLGNLPEKENNEVDVLSGAYMMVKKEVLDKTGGFDESFFMYGEDIDLSYRIKQAGYVNYYLGLSSIIHFKGESTKKDIQYTKMFYKAMNIFVQKHYSKKSVLFAMLMQIAIAVSGGLSFAGSIFSSNRKSLTNSKIINTIVAGELAETKGAGEILMADQQIKRAIRYMHNAKEIQQAIQTGTADEIIFCAGTLCYKEIIGCMQSLPGTIAYKFFAAGSKSIVGSMSKNSSGEVMILPGA